MRQAALPWSPRSPLLGVLVSVVLTCVSIVFFSQAVFRIGSSAQYPRMLTPIESVPFLLALMWVIVNRPRLYEVEALGQSRVLALAILHAVAALIIPCGTYVAICELLRATGQYRFYEPYVHLSNIVVVGLAAIILVGLFGELVGSVVWLTLVFGNLYAQGSDVAFVGFLPLKGHDAAHHLSVVGVNWPWLLGLTVVALGVVGRRRSVPVTVFRAGMHDRSSS